MSKYTRLFVSVNDDNEYPRKAEYIKYRNIAMPGDFKIRFDKSWQSLDNFLWFFKFEVAFKEKEALEKRKELKVIE